MFLSWEEMDVLFKEDVIERIRMGMESCCAWGIA